MHDLPAVNCDDIINSNDLDGLEFGKNAPDVSSFKFENQFCGNENGNIEKEI